MNDTFIKSECYICFEPCLEKSPCSCGTSVHNECLVKFLEISGNIVCTICTDEFKIVTKKRKNTYKMYWLILSCCFMMLILCIVMWILV